MDIIIPNQTSRVADKSNELIFNFLKGLKLDMRNLEKACCKDGQSRVDINKLKSFKTLDVHLDTIKNTLVNEGSMRISEANTLYLKMVESARNELKKACYEFGDCPPPRVTKASIASNSLIVASASGALTAVFSATAAKAFFQWFDTVVVPSAGLVVAMFSPTTVGASVAVGSSSVATAYNVLSSFGTSLSNAVLGAPEESTDLFYSDKRLVLVWIMLMFFMVTIFKYMYSLNKSMLPEAALIRGSPSRSRGRASPSRSRSPPRSPPRARAIRSPSRSIRNSRLASPRR